MNATLLATYEEIAALIDRLIPKAETGEQWAHICLLEQQMLELRSTTREDI